MDMVNLSSPSRLLAKSVLTVKIVTTTPLQRKLNSRKQPLKPQVATMLAPNSQGGKDQKRPRFREDPRTAVPRGSAHACTSEIRNTEFDLLSVGEGGYSGTERFPRRCLRMDFREPVDEMNRTLRHLHVQTLITIAVTWIMLNASWQHSLVQAQENRSNQQSGLNVQIETIEGDTQSGQLQQLSGSKVEVGLSGDNALSLELTELASIQLDTIARTSPPTRVSLAGGSVIAAAVASMESESLLIRSVGQPELSVPIKTVRSVRFRAASPGTDPTWMGLIEEPQRRDRLVIRREGDSLDAIEGTILGITRESVSFDLGGNVVEAPLSKLEGVIFSNTPGDRPQKSIRVNDQWGSEWLADSVAWDSKTNALTFSLESNLSHSIPMSQVMSLQFSGGILYLSEAEVARSSASVAVNRLVGDDLASTWFGAEPMEKNVVTQFQSEHVVRIPEGYQQLVAAVRIADEVDEFTPVVVSVLLDDQVVWTKELTDREPIGFALPMENHRQVTLRTTLPETETNSDSDLGNSLGHRVEWLGARLLK